MIYIFTPSHLQILHLHTLTSADLHLHTFTPADLHLHTLTSADLHLHTFTPADLHLHTLTSADLDLHTLTSADLHLHTLTPADLHLHTLTSADLHLRKIFLRPGVSFLGVRCSNFASISPFFWQMSNVLCRDLVSTYGCVKLCSLPANPKEFGRHMFRDDS